MNALNNSLPRIALAAYGATFLRYEAVPQDAEDHSQAAVVSLIEAAQQWESRPGVKERRGLVAYNLLMKAMGSVRRRAQEEKDRADLVAALSDIVSDDGDLDFYGVEGPASEDQWVTSNGDVLTSMEIVARALEDDVRPMVAGLLGLDEDDAGSIGVTILRALEEESIPPLYDAPGERSPLFLTELPDTVVRYSTPNGEEELTVSGEEWAEATRRASTNGAMWGDEDEDQYDDRERPSWDVMSTNRGDPYADQVEPEQIGLLALSRLVSSLVDADEPDFRRVGQAIDCPDFDVDLTDDELSIARSFRRIAEQVERYDLDEASQRRIVRFVAEQAISSGMTPPTVPDYIDSYVDPAPWLAGIMFRWLGLSSTSGFSHPGTSAEACKRIVAKFEEWVAKDAYASQINGVKVLLAGGSPHAARTAYRQYFN